MPTVELYSSVTGASTSNWRYALAFNSVPILGTDYNGTLIQTSATSQLAIYSTANPVPSGYVSGATLATYTPLITFSGASSAIHTPSYNATNTDNSFTEETIFSTGYVAASASGTASWFLYGTFATFPSSPRQEIIGTVGAPGSGADLIIGSTAITAGSLYKVTFSILFPLSWSW